MLAAMKLLFPLSLLAAVAVLGGSPGCARKDGGASVSGGHVHAAPHGGRLIELGEHAHNLEIVRDAEGRLTLYVLDGHADSFIRLTTPVIEAIATVSGEKRRLTFKAVANPVTGETVGNTSQFEAQPDWVKATPDFEAVIPQLEIRGRVYSDVALRLPKSGP